MVTKKCPTCGELFPTPNMLRIYCSESCKMKNYRERKKSGKVKKIYDKGMGKCKGCGEPYKINAPNHQFCTVECRREHLKDFKRDYDSKRYIKYGTEKKLRMKGTISLGPHLRQIQPLTYLGAEIPYTRFIKEIKVIRKDKKRTLNERRDKGIKSWKGNINGGGSPGMTDRTMTTHGYVTPYEVANHHTKELLNVPVTVCPECEGREIIKDTKHAEIVCRTCGLVLMGPEAPLDGYRKSIKYPYRQKPNPEGELSERQFEPLIRPKPKTYKGLVKVICKRCSKAFTIEHKHKEGFNCDCGGSVIGIGICKEHPLDWASEQEGREPKIGYDLRTTEDRLPGE